MGRGRIGGRDCRLAALTGVAHPSVGRVSTSNGYTPRRYGYPNIVYPDDIGIHNYVGPVVQDWFRAGIADGSVAILILLANPVSGTVLGMAGNSARCPSKLSMSGSRFG